MANPTCLVLWWALVASLPVYVAVAHVATVPGSPSVPTSILLPAFVVLSLGIALGTLTYRRRALAEPIQAGSLDPRTPAGMQRAFPPFILNLVLSESVGIQGLVLAFLSGRPAYAIAFALAAFGLMYLHRPTAPDLAPRLGSPGVAERPPPIR